jgi:DNA-binding protein HU-beta
LTRAELVRLMAEAAGWPRVVSDRALRSMLLAMRVALKRHDAVTLVGFGTFSVTRRRPRAIRNPRTGRSATVGARAPRFKPSEDLKRAVR